MPLAILLLFLTANLEPATGPWEAIVQIVQVVSAVLLAYIAYLQVKNGAKATAIGIQAGQAATAAHDSATSAAGLVATVAENAGRQDARLEEIHANGIAAAEEGHKTHVLVNSQKLQLETWNNLYRKQLEAAGIVPAEEPAAVKPDAGPPPADV